MWMINMTKSRYTERNTVKPEFKRPSIQVTRKSLLTGGCLLLNESSAESFLHYFHAAISNYLSEKPRICLVLYINL